MDYLKQLNEALKTIENLKTINQNLENKVQNLQLQNQSLTRMLFGAKRERTPITDEVVDGVQYSLFAEQEIQEEEMDKNIDKEIEAVTEETITYTRKTKNRRGGIKRSFLDNVELVKEEFVIKDGTVCPECSSELKPIGKKVVREEIEYVPAKLRIKAYIKMIYKCTKCGGKNSEKETSTFIQPKVPKPMLAHSFASPSLATEVIYQKYYLGTPLYRQEKMWEDKGLVLPRSMTSNWMIKLSEYYLEPLRDLIFKELKNACEVGHADETTIQVNKEPDRSPTSTSYMWVFASGANEKLQGVVYDYNKSRSSETAQKFLKGFKGILVTDGYSSYNTTDASVHAECWSHARRYFFECIPLDENKKPITNCYGHTGLQYCNKLFDIERKIADFSVEEKVRIRQEKSKPILDEFFAWVNETLTQKVIANDKLKKALTYASNQQKELSEFLNDGRIPLTNNRCEQAIRPFAVHRKNFLFSDTIPGAKANAVMYSIIESAKANHLNIYRYINYLLEQLPQLENPTDEKELEKFLPWSKELPKDVLNFQGSYNELTVDSKLIVDK